MSSADREVSFIRQAHATLPVALPSPHPGADLTKRAQEGMMPFRDRSEAGRRLAKALAAYKLEKPVILALPRGGVPVAAEVAAALDAPLDLILVRKIGAPMQPELAIGAVANGGAPLVVRNDDVIRMAGVDEAQFEAV